MSDWGNAFAKGGNVSVEKGQAVSSDMRLSVPQDRTPFKASSDSGTFSAFQSQGIVTIPPAQRTQTSFGIVAVPVIKLTGMNPPALCSFKGLWRLGLASDSHCLPLSKDLASSLSSVRNRGKSLLVSSNSCVAVLSVGWGRSNAFISTGFL